MREASTADRPALVAMLGQCSAETRVRRFGGHIRTWPEPFVTDCLSSPPECHDALVLAAPTLTAPGTLATESDRSIVGLATAARVERGVADISLLIEDAWQRRGLGHRLLGALLDRAAARGVRRLAFQVNADQAWLLTLAPPHLRVTATRLDGPVLLVDAALDPAARG